MTYDTNRQNIEIKTPEEIDVMAEGGRRLRAIVQELADMVKPGVTTYELDALATKGCREHQCEPAFLGYRGYPATICCSLNEEIVHGIPSKGRVIEEGDLVSIDMGILYEGFFVDKAVTVIAGGATDPQGERLLSVTRQALSIGTQMSEDGRRLGDLCAAIQHYVEEEGFNVVREYSGHGIGRQLHEAPQIPNYGRQGTGVRLRTGMTLAIEPMVTEGDWHTQVREDGWTVVTADGMRAGHFEHTVAITPEGPLILT